MAEIITRNGVRYRKVLDVDIDFCNICALKDECNRIVKEDENADVLCGDGCNYHFERID